ncbi:hypothetical protein niasHT_017461 [Heterodera trifolii]|uniref:Uncharacterized protein n=1 Tax=Heterodera trifolii TaxID=157864 RepID=A0ABD2LF61_9BILA
MCSHFITKLNCTYASILADQTIKVEPHKKFRHRAVRLTVVCTVCGTSASRTHDFNSTGKYAFQGLRQIQGFAIMRCVSMSSAWFAKQPLPALMTSVAREARKMHMPCQHHNKL